MTYKIIILEPAKFRDALQQDDRLFDAVKELVETHANGRDPKWHHIARQPSVVVTQPAPPERVETGRLIGEKN